MTRIPLDSPSSSSDEATFLPHAGYCVAAILVIARFIAGTLGYFGEDPRPVPAPQATFSPSSPATPAKDAAAPPAPSPSRAPMSGFVPTLRRMR